MPATEQVYTRLEPDEMERLKALAKREDRSISNQARVLLRDGLRRALEPQEAAGAH